MFMEQDQEQTQHMGLHWGFLKQKFSNKPFTIVGNGKQKRDFIYVTDVCNAF